jgi:cyclopropane-fatty-acyl-phospholipid synthase
MYFEEYRSRSDFIQKYIFPGGMLPSEERLKRVTAKAGFVWTGIDRFGLDYADTLAEWHASFDKAWNEIRPLGFDERFRKLWKFYLSYCEAGFRTQRTNVVQLSLAKA